VTFRRALLPVNTGSDLDIEASGIAVADSHSVWDEQSVVCSESLLLIFRRANGIRVNFIAVDMQEFGLEGSEGIQSDGNECKQHAGVLRGTDGDIAEAERAGDEWTLDEQVQKRCCNAYVGAWAGHHHAAEKGEFGRRLFQWHLTSYESAYFYHAPLGRELILKHVFSHTRTQMNEDPYQLGLHLWGPTAAAMPPCIVPTRGR
jgi:hypothetical protein